MKDGKGEGAVSVTMCGMLREINEWKGNEGGSGKAEGRAKAWDESKGRRVVHGGDDQRNQSRCNMVTERGPNLITFT